MEMSHGSRRLETLGMEEDGGCCRCCGAAGPHGNNISTKALRQKETRLQRIAQCLAAGLLVLISVALALLITVVHAWRGSHSPDGQVNFSIPASYFI